MLQQNKYHPLPTKAPNRLLNRLTVGGSVHKEVQNEKFHRATPLGDESDGCWVSSHHHKPPNVAQTLATSPLGPSQKNPISESPPTGHPCFTIQLFFARGEGPTLQATSVKTTVSTSAFATSRCCYRCWYWPRGAGLRWTRGTKSGHAKCRSLRVANPNSTSASEKPWRHEDDGWYTHTEKKNSVHKCAKGKPMVVGDWDRFPDPEN